MTSGAMKQGVPQKVLRARYFCAAHAVWNCALLLALVALLGLSAANIKIYPKCQAAPHMGVYMRVGELHYNARESAA